MTKTTKLLLLSLVIVSQVFYAKYVIIRDIKIPTIKPGQVWEYKSTLPFHENETPLYHTVIGVKDEWVQYTITAPTLPSGVWTSDCSARVFIIDSKLVKDVTQNTK